MTKIKLGNDFTDDSETAKDQSEESDQKTSDDESEDEKDNSGDSDNSKKPESDEADKSEDDKGDNSDDADKTDDTEADDSKSDADDKSDGVSTKEKEPDKAKVLETLLEVEKNLDKDVGDVDVLIASAKQRLYEKRKDRREKRDLVETIDQKFPDTDKEEENTDDLSDIDPETLKVLDRFTKAKGLVPKSELQKMNYQEQHKNAQDLFYASHPEYLPENDTDDILYKAIKNELAQFAAPKDPKSIPSLFAKAHRLVMDQFPDKFKNIAKKTDSDSDKNKSVRLKTAGLGGKSSSGGGDSSGKSSAATKKSFAPEQIRALEDGGWTPEEIKKLTG